LNSDLEESEGYRVVKSGKDKQSAGTGRKERLASELRANLKRRKARSRDAQAGQASTVEVKKKPE
jgi:hypothetical protein